MATTLGQQVQLRPARPEDIDDIARVIHDPPEPPFGQLLGRQRATKLGTLMVKSGQYPALANTTVAVLDGRVVGMLECGGKESEPTVSGMWRILPRIILICGPIFPRAVYGFWLRGRLTFDVPAGGFLVSELYVDEHARNQGIGARLLQRADEQAKSAGAERMYVETGITNPAKRLYERHGFRVIEEKRSVANERLTGSPGRILMLKELTPGPAASS